MSVKLLTEHHLEFLSLKGGCTGSSKSTLVKMPHCWKSHVVAHFIISVGPATDGRVESSTPDQTTDTAPTAVTSVAERQRNDNARCERTLCLRPPTAVDEC